MYRRLAAIAIGGLTLFGASPASAHTDILRTDCTQFGWLSVQTSSDEAGVLRTGNGVVVAHYDEGTVRTTVRDWHPTRGGHIKVLRTHGVRSTTPLCGVTLKPEAGNG